MKVILAGYSKTGTKTLAAAFTELGFTTFDYLENYYYLYNEWMRIFKGEATNADIRKMFEGVDALVDCPVFHYWEELHGAFPDAKIIITIRDEEEWFKSLMHQMEVANKSYLLLMMNTFWFQGYLRREFRQYTRRFYGRVKSWPSSKVIPHHEKLLRAHYRQHNRDVMKKVPKDKLLVYKVTDGWGPLCEFLGVAIPDQPFPHKNKGATVLSDWLSEPIIQSILMQSSATILLLLVVAGYAGHRLCRTASWKSWLGGVCAFITS